MITSQKYAFTVTLKPVMYRWSARVQYTKTHRQLMECVKNLGQVTLVAELTKNGNIHYHGVIQFNMRTGYKGLITQLFHDRMRTLCNVFGHHNITPITDEEGWISYLKKGQESFLTTVEMAPVITDEFMYFTPDIIKQLGMERPSDSGGSLQSPKSPSSEEI